GREHVAGALFGSAARSHGTIALGGVAIPPGSPRAAIASGLALVPSDRARAGLVMQHSLRENITLPSLANLSTPLGVSTRRERPAVYRLLRSLSVRPAEPERRVATLSGGNQQKVLLAKWLRTKPRVLVLDEPGQGVDVGARA